MMRLALSSLIVVLVAAVPRYAAADDPQALPASPQALQHFDEGGAYFEAGEYDQAVAEYEAGAQLEDLPAWDWNLGLAHQRAGNLKRARWYFGRFISRIESMADVGDYIAAARLHIDEIDAAQEKLERQEGEGRQTDEGVAASPPSSFTMTRKIAVGVGVVGLVAGGIGVALSLRAQGFEDDAETLCPTTECSRAEESNRLAREANTNNGRALVAYSVGAVGVGVAILLWLIGEPEHTTHTQRAQRAQRAVAVPRLSPNYVGVDVTMRF